MKTYFTLWTQYLPDGYNDAKNKNNESNQGKTLTGINGATQKIVILEVESSKNVEIQNKR